MNVNDRRTENAVFDSYWRGEKTTCNHIYWWQELKNDSTHNSNTFNWWIFSCMVDGKLEYAKNILFAFGMIWYEKQKLSLFYQKNVLRVQVECEFLAVLYSTYTLPWDWKNNTKGRFAWNVSYYYYNVFSESVGSCLDHFQFSAGYV